MGRVGLERGLGHPRPRRRTAFFVPCWTSSLADLRFPILERLSDPNPLLRQVPHLPDDPRDERLESQQWKSRADRAPRGSPTE